MKNSVSAVAEVSTVMPPIPAFLHHPLKARPRSIVPAFVAQAAGLKNQGNRLFQRDLTVIGSGSAGLVLSGCLSGGSLFLGSSFVPAQAHRPSSRHSARSIAKNRFACFIFASYYFDDQQSLCNVVITSLAQIRLFSRVFSKKAVLIQNFVSF